MPLHAPRHPAPEIRENRDKHFRFFNGSPEEPAL
jgi:hypothetical protein